MKYYKTRRPHQGLEYKRPMEIYRGAAQFLGIARPGDPRKLTYL
ncbi:hypothetical protein [Petrimonas sp.]